MSRFPCSDPTHPSRECDPVQCTYCAEHCIPPVDPQQGHTTDRPCQKCLAAEATRAPD